MNIGQELGLDILDLGLIPFQEAFACQLKVHNQVLVGKKPQTLILCEHPRTITLGRNSNIEDILDYQTIKNRQFDFVIGLNRGGEITYHGPGQLIGYLIFDLRKLNKDLGGFINRIEDSLIQTLSNYGIGAEKKSKFRGVWVGNKKIASIGIGVDRYVSLHGFALNVNTELSDFSLIRPCVLEVGMTSIKKEKGFRVAIQEVKSVITKNFRSNFCLSNQPIEKAEVAYV